MPDFADFQQVVASGADLATVALAYFIWKIDRRLLMVEQQLKSVWKQIPKQNQGGNS